ncbi:MAG: ArsR/SmtB family transcription factor [Candidatus Rifleibacteriota bacterium]
MNLEKSARIFKIFSVDTRLRIVRLLKHKPLCVNALSRKLNITPAAVSQHLRILRDSEFVIAQKSGYFVHYRLNQAKLKQIKRDLNQIFNFSERGNKTDE